MVYRKAKALTPGIFAATALDGQQVIMTKVEAALSAVNFATSAGPKKTLATAGSSHNVSK
jgi:hypothetical protein